MHQAAVDIMSGVPSAVGGQRLAALKNCDWSEALKGVNPTAFETPWEYLQAAQAAALVRKLPALRPGQHKSLKEAAVKTFHLCEETCKMTNDRLAYYVNLVEKPFFEDELDEKMFGLIQRMRAKARHILGPLPKHLSPKFSGGATFLNVAKKKTLPHKMSGSCAVTPSLAPVFHLLTKDYDLWQQAIATAGTEVVQGNRFETVPKDSEKDRGICVEPLGNLAFQLGVGNYIRERLRRVAQIDIANASHSPYKGQNLHKLMARFASIDDDFATIDLSNASDTIAHMFVKLLLPPEWYSLLNMLRSPATRVNGEWVKLQKFSSMGNGFTFELETLLFYVVCVSVCEHSVVTVYGDDMIVPSEDYDNVVAALTFFGFSVNAKKSFKNGPFRESCGGDYFQGVDVNVIDLKKAPSNPLEWIGMYNRLYKVSRTMHWDMAVPMQRIIETLPKWCRVFGPPGVICEDDDYPWLWTDDSGLWKTRANATESWCEIRCLKRMPTFYRDWLQKQVALLCALLGSPSKGVDTGSVSGWRLAWTRLE